MDELISIMSKAPEEGGDGGFDGVMYVNINKRTLTMTH